MPSNKKNDTTYLRLRHNIWHYRRRTPKALKHIYTDKIIEFSLNTGDIRIAKAKRDKQNGILASQLITAANPNAARFRQIVRQLEDDKKDSPRHWDAGYDVREKERAGERIFVDAYTTVTGAKDKSGEYGFSLLEALNTWQEKEGFKKTATTQRKVEQTVKQFLHFHEAHDLCLQSISRRDVYDFIQFLANNYAKATVSGYISRLKGLWQFAKNMCDVTGENPFQGHRMDGTSGIKKYELFTPEDLQALVEKLNDATRERKLIFQLGLFTGARLSEICGIKAGNIKQASGHWYYHIEKGKTKDATRNVPIPPELVGDILSLREGLADDDLLFSVDSKTYSRWFSTQKTPIIKNDRKTFHSLRVGFSTALKRCDVQERYAAEILGHKRGETMSYGYYAKENELAKLAAEAQKAFDYIKGKWLN